MELGVNNPKLHHVILYSRDVERRAASLNYRDIEENYEELRISSGVREH